MAEADFLEIRAAYRRHKLIDRLPPLTVGEPFMPFATLSGLPTLENSAQEYDNRLIIPIFTSRFRLGSIPGLLSLLAYTDTTKRGQMAETPLGPVRKVMTISGDGKTNAQRYTELPLSLASSFRIFSMKEFKILEEHMFRFTLGSKEYFLNCSGNEYRVTVGFDLQEGDREKEIIARYLHSEPDHGSQILLPWDHEKLRTIEATIVEKGVAAPRI